MQQHFCKACGTLVMTKWFTGERTGGFPHAEAEYHVQGPLHSGLICDPCYQKGYRVKNGSLTEALDNV